MSLIPTPVHQFIPKLRSQKRGRQNPRHLGVSPDLKNTGETANNGHEESPEECCTLQLGDWVNPLDAWHRRRDTSVSVCTHTAVRRGSHKPQWENQSHHHPPHDLRPPDLRSPPDTGGTDCSMFPEGLSWVKHSLSNSVLLCMSLLKVEDFKSLIRLLSQHYGFTARCCLSSMYLKLEIIYQICK